MGSANTAMAIILLAFNISTCFYVRRLIKAFHHDQNCLPTWAKVSRTAIGKLEGSFKELFLDDLLTDDPVMSLLESKFFGSSLFKHEDSMRLQITERGFDMRDDMELKKMTKDAQALKTSKTMAAKQSTPTTKTTVATTTETSSQRTTEEQEKEKREGGAEDLISLALGDENEKEEPTDLHSVIGDLKSKFIGYSADIEKIGIIGSS
jgi:hypothetical protein